MSIIRSNYNPIISPSDVSPSKENMEVIGVFNAGVAKHNNDIILILRVAERPINNDPECYLTPVYDPKSNQIIIERIPKHPEYDFSDVRVIKTPKRNYLTSISHMRVARSQDGINFKIDAQPTILPGTIYESYGIEDPRITQIGTHYYITYSAVSEYGICTGLITTTDFEVFQREGNVWAIIVT